MKKTLLGAFLLLSAVTMAEMTPKQEAELDKLTKIFYPDTDMRADRRAFKDLQRDAYNNIVEMRGEAQNGMSEEAFNEIWAEVERRFPGDFIQQKREIDKAFVGYRAADAIRAEEKKKEAEVKKVLNAEAKEDILEIKSEEHMVPKEVMDRIIADAEAAHPEDHVAQREEIENKIKAYEDMLQYFDLSSPKK